MRTFNHHPKLLVFIIASFCQNSLCAQNEKYILYPCKGEILYKKMGKWTSAYRATALEDTVWISLKTTPGQYLIKKNTKCATITEEGTQQIRSIPLSSCNENSIFNFFEKISKGSSEQNLIVPASPMNLSFGDNDMLFPANNEHIIKDSAIQFQWKKKGRNKSVVVGKEKANSKALFETVNKLVKSSPGLPLKQEEDFTYMKFKDPDTIKTIAASDINFLTAGYNPSETLWWSSSDAINESNVLKFSFADAKEIESLQSQLTALESIKSNFDDINFQIVKATIYNNLKMYSEARKIYRESLSRYPNAINLKDAYANLIQRVTRINYEGFATNSLHPKIMVIPRVPQGGNIKASYDTSMNMQIAIAKINEAFQKRGANLISFDQSLKQVAQNGMINKSSGNQEDIKSMIIENSGSDIYVEVALDVVLHRARAAKSVTLILEAYQAGTGNSMASRTIPGPMFQTDDLGRLTMMAMDTVSESFLNLMQLRFDDIIENGQSVYVEFSLAKNSKYDFDSEISGQGKSLSEIMDDWFSDHAKNGVYNNQGVTANKMIFSDVRIPLKKPDNPNVNYTGQNLFVDIFKYLKSIGVASKRELSTNNKILLTIL